MKIGRKKILIAKRTGMQINYCNSLLDLSSIIGEERVNGDDDFSDWRRRNKGREAVIVKIKRRS